MRLRTPWRRARVPAWWSVLCGFGRIGCTSFGGGSATVAAMRQLCRRRGWLDDGQFLDTVVLSRLTPGITILAQVLLIGRSVAGLPGMVAGLLGMTAPSITITIALAWCYELVRGLPEAGGPLRALAAVAAGFAVALALQLLRDVLRQGPLARGAVIFLGYLAASLLVNNPLVVMGIAIVAGLLVPTLFDPPAPPSAAEASGQGDDAPSDAPTRRGNDAPEQP